MKIIDLEIFAERLKECRENQGLTVRELAEKVETSAANISRYENAIHGPGRDVIASLSEFFNVNPSWLMGASVDKYSDQSIEGRKVPVLGVIAAGMPILAQENIEGYEFVPENSRVNFCLRVKGDSMINARITDGDLVYIQQQSSVENGEIAAVLIDGEEATLKRFFHANGKVTLRSENPNYPDKIFTKKDMKEVKIIGKAIFFKSEVR